MITDIVKQLRELADGLDAMKPGLTPLPADLIRPGDLIRPSINEWLEVKTITVVDPGEDRPAGPLLKFHGKMLDSPHGKNFPSSHTEWADEWVVVER